MPGVEEPRYFWVPSIAPSGLAFYTGDLFPATTVGHTGFTGTSFTLSPADGFYVVLLTNRVCPSRDNTAIYRVRRLIHNAAYAARG